MKYCLRLSLLFLLISTISFAQSYAQDMTISGVVISAEDNEPVIGASVSVKSNPTLGAITDFNGEFSFTAPQGTGTIVITSIGMKPVEVAARAGLDIRMYPDDAMLEEVVVTGLVVQDKRLFTGAATKLDASKTKLDGVADISRSLEGRAAGVSVQNVSGTFGTAPKIRIRGATSIYGNSKPLWVVDGVIMPDAVDISSDELASGNAETLISSAIAGINADDIESIQILKDGSATSIYGARAMGGVIVVTTKKGQAGVSRISYSGEFTTRLKPTYDDFNISNSQEQMGIYREMEAKGWLEFASVASRSASGVYGKMYDLLKVYDPDTGEYGILQDDAVMNAYLRNSEFINTNWFDELFNLNIVQNHTISMSSGTDKAQFYMSLSAMNDPGWTKSSSVDRYTFNANGSYKISPTVTINVKGTGSQREQKAPGTLAQEVDVVSGTVSRGFDINPYSYAMNTSRTLDPKESYRRNYAPFNIFHELENNYIELGVTDVSFQGELTWNILKGWKANMLGAMRYMKSSQEHHVTEHSNMAQAYRAGSPDSEYGEDELIRSSNPYLWTDRNNPEALPESVLPKGGIYTRTDYMQKSWDFTATTNYVNSFNNDTHIINLFGGTQITSTEYSKDWYRAWGVLYENSMEPFFDPNVFVQSKEENTPYYGFSPTTQRNVAFFGMGTYSYKSKYVFNGTLRYEGTNKLGRSRSARWLPTWNISGAWNIHEESFFDKQKVLSHAMLKLSYSLTGDAGPTWVTNSLPIFLPTTTWRPDIDAIESGLYLSETQNDDLTYEKKHEFNVGINVGFLNDRINLESDYFHRENFDLIGQVYTTGIGGGGISKWANVAEMKSSGVEVSISTQNIITKDFKWTTDFNFAYITNEITSLDTKTQAITLIRGSGGNFGVEGYPRAPIFSIPYVGLNEEGLPTFFNEKGELTVSDIYFQENTNLEYLVYEGPSEPTTTGGFGNTFSWKGLTLNAFITYSFGNVIRLYPSFSSSYSDLTAMPREFANRWVVPGDESITEVPVIASLRQLQNASSASSSLSYAYSAYNYSTYRIADGGFVRMKELSLSYEIPKKICNALRINNASVKLMGTNLFLIYADKKLNGQDPEFFNTGGVASPMPKQFTLTVRFGI